MDSLHDLKDAANRLVTKSRQRNPLAAPVPRQQIGAGIGFAEPQVPKSSGTGGGLASPLSVLTTEGTSSMSIASSDGIFVLYLPLTVNCRDASGNAVKVKFPA
jgi:hypothetical protein